MPHESTVQHGALEPETRWFPRSRSICPRTSPISTDSKETPRKNRSTVPHLKAETPKTITHHIDVIEEDKPSTNIIKKIIK